MKKEQLEEYSVCLDENGIEINHIEIMNDNDTLEPQDDDKYGMGCVDDNKPHHRPVHAYDGWEACWPGDGSGMDDFADYNQNEGRD